MRVLNIVAKARL